MTVYDLIVHMVSGLAVVGGRWEDMEVTLVTEDGKEQPLRVLFSVTPEAGPTRLALSAEVIPDAEDMDMAVKAYTDADLALAREKHRLALHEEAVEMIDAMVKEC